MVKTNLSSSEIQDLINRYNSELKKLEFQIDDVKLTIYGLENLMKDVNSRENTAFAKVKPRKLSSSNILSTKKGRKESIRNVKSGKIISSSPERLRNKKNEESQTAKGYKLSDWDLFVIEGIREAGKVRITEEILDFVKSKMIASGKKTTDNEVKNKVTRSLQKLVNRRGDLAKVSYKGKGFAYALPEWTGQKGKLQPEYKR